ncbi:molybdopterin-dependent oxidoreductase [Actinoplanes solisilvae]|uniref:molybdopterin-dependent oxidoreductase n=1 Tax=Actinoplanes solisilvae TaxID=2486853 RepID=UPI000FDCDB51|nr:molybdopterin-dependent oxidoreductase [Actinoplanes solisilvae]
MNEAGRDPELDGRPVGRRTVLGLIALAGAGVVGGKAVQDGLAKVLGPIELRDPTGLISLLPWGDSFRFYSVTGAVPTMNAETYRLTVGGLVRRTASYTLADLRAMPQISLVRDFHCITGWQVSQVHWSGVQLSTLLDLAGPTAAATAVRFRSFDGTYTESLTLEQARLDDVIVALTMLGGPVTHEHGGPVRMYVAPMYGYKSTKWLSAIELTAAVETGYWEHRGYPVDGFIDPSRGKGA